MRCSDEQMRAEVYGIRQRGATATANSLPARRAAQLSSSLREVDAHAGQEAAQAELDLDTLPLVTPDTLLELLIRALEPGQPRRQRVIAAADVVLVSYRAPQALVRVAAHRAMSGAGL